MDFEYKTVPAPTVLSIKTEKEAEQAIYNFGKLINLEAQGGWEFHSMETITTEAAPGCFSGGKPNTMRHNMLIFKRERKPLD